MGLRGSDIACEQAVAAHDWALAVSACRDTYARTHDPHVGLALTRSLSASGKPKEAATLATALLATPQWADASGILGSMALTSSDTAAALAYCGRALFGHVVERNRAAASRDAHRIA